MKTVIKTLFATALTAVVLSSSAFASFAKDEDKKPSVQEAVSGFNMIKVKGNVRVYLIQGNKESLRLEPGQSDARISLDRKGQKLTISSNDFEMTTVYLTVKNLQRIEVSEQAVVKSNGHFELPLLQIFVQDDAKVDVNITAQDLYTVIKDRSSLKLSGKTELLTLIKDDASKLNTSKLAVARTTVSKPVFAAIDIDAQFDESLNFNLAAINSKHLK